MPELVVGSVIATGVATLEVVRINRVAYRRMKGTYKRQTLMHHLFRSWHFDFSVSRFSVRAA